MKSIGSSVEKQSTKTPTGITGFDEVTREPRELEIAAAPDAKDRTSLSHLKRPRIEFEQMPALRMETFCKLGLENLKV